MLYFYLFLRSNAHGAVPGPSHTNDTQTAGYLQMMNDQNLEYQLQNLNTNGTARIAYVSVIAQDGSISYIPISMRRGHSQQQ